MRTFVSIFFPWRVIILLLLSCCVMDQAKAQDLLKFIDNCKNCKGKVKRIITKQKLNSTDFQSPQIYQLDEYNSKEQLIKTEIKIGGALEKTIYYGYKDSLLIYQHHLSPFTEEFYLVYQYYKKSIPAKIVKVDKKNNIILYADIEYTKELLPVYLKFYNLLGELLEMRSVEYFSSNQVVIRYFNPKNKHSKLQKYELLCKYNHPEKLKKNDFKDVITKPINLTVEDDFVRVVNAVQTDAREKIEIEELTYDQAGNWVNKKTFELKKNKNKRRLINEIEREIEYFQ